MFIRSQQIISPSEKWTNKEEDKFVHPIVIHFGSLHIYMVSSSTSWVSVNTWYKLNLYQELYGRKGKDFPISMLVYRIQGWTLYSFPFQLEIDLSLLELTLHKFAIIPMTTISMYHKSIQKKILWSKGDSDKHSLYNRTQNPGQLSFAPCW